MCFFKIKKVHLDGEHWGYETGREYMYERNRLEWKFFYIFIVVGIAVGLLKQDPSAGLLTILGSMFLPFFLAAIVLDYVSKNKTNLSIFVGLMLFGGLAIYMTYRALVL